MSPSPLELIGTPVAPGPGIWEVTAGGVVSGEAVVDEHHVNPVVCCCRMCRSGTRSCRIDTHRSRRLCHWRAPPAAR